MLSEPQWLLPKQNDVAVAVADAVAVAVASRVAVAVAVAAVAAVAVALARQPYRWYTKTRADAAWDEDRYRGKRRGQ